MGTAVAAMAGTEEEIHALKNRIAQLEHKHSVNELPIHWFGALEVEAFYTDMDGESASDITVATASLGAQVQLLEKLTADIVLLHEEDDTDLEVDEAFFNYSASDQWAVTLGQVYVPFGQYSTVAINDPLTLEIGETRESVLMLTYSGKALSADVYVFNGDTDIHGDVVDNLGARISYQLESDQSSFTVSLDITNNLLDSDTLGDSGLPFNEKVGGASVALILESDGWGAMAEWLSVTTDIDASVVSMNGDDARPSALQLEAYLSGQLMGHDTLFSLGFHQTADALFLELPETRLSATARLALSDQSEVTVELFNDRDYSESDSSNGISGSDADMTTLLFQWASAF